MHSSLNRFHTQSRLLAGPRVALHTAMLACTAAALFSTGCARTRLSAARQQYYSGNFAAASNILSNTPPGKTDRVLWLMEKGSALQALHKYKESTHKWLKAVSLAEQLDYYSLSRSTESMLINDSVIAFRGTPYERTMLRTFLSFNYLAREMWEDAAVEARNIVYRLDSLEDFPDDPFSRYVAGVCFELSREHEAAVFQYRKTSELLDEPSVNPMNGQFNAPGSRVNRQKRQNELVCFVLTGKAALETENTLSAPPRGYAEVFCRGRYLGRTHELVNTHDLRKETNRKIAAMKETKKIARIIAKDAISDAVSDKNDFLGEILRLILFSLETPDHRHWSSLPLSCQVARVDCPDNLEEYTLVLRNSLGTVRKRVTVHHPITKRDRLYVSFYRFL